MVTKIGLLVLLLVLSIILGLLYCRFRSPSDLEIAEALYLEVWNAVPGDAHRSNTDLFKYKGQYLLVHATSRWHFASKKCKLIVRCEGIAPDGVV